MPREAEAPRSTTAGIGGVATRRGTGGASGSRTGSGTGTGCVNEIGSGTFGAASACAGPKPPVLHNTTARQITPAAKPSANAAAVFMSSLLQRGRRAGPDHARQFQGGPIGQPYAPVRAGVAHLAGLRRAVNPVRSEELVLFKEGR